MLQALHDQGYHKGLAAKALGITRRYLYTKMVLHGIPLTRLELKEYTEKHLGMK
jgi:hypothetical protein